MATAVLGTLGGCMGSMVCVESLAKEHPSAMNLMTFSTFFFISLEGLIVTTQFFTVKNRIPLSGYIPVVAAFFLTNVINNQALNFRVPVTLHIIFRSGSLLTTLLMNRIFMRRKYTLTKYLSVFAITIGIIVCTLASSKVEKDEDKALTLAEMEKHYTEWLIGIFMLTVALIISSLLAICQERMYAKHGKHSREAMFYVHFISLPLFAFMGEDIWRSAVEFWYAPPLRLFDFTIFPWLSGLWMKLVAACISQWLCIMFVYRLNSEVDSLTVTLVVTLRKFLSLLVSIFWFGNLFTMTHWVGALLVFGGTLIFSDVYKQLRR